MSIEERPSGHRNSMFQKKILYLLFGISMLICFQTNQVYAVDENPIWKVEVDWEIRITNPDAAKSSPQISLIISAFSHLDSWHGELTINTYSSGEASGEGGIGTRLWNGLTPRIATYSRGGEPMNVVGGRIDVTQEFSLIDGTLWSCHGASTSDFWGTIGRYGGGTSNHTLTDLNSFDINVSINESGVAVGRNRVERIRINKVRIYRVNEDVVEDSYSQDIFLGLNGTAEAGSKVNPDGTLYEQIPIDQSTKDAVILETGF